MNHLIVILGTTASGKTQLACQLARIINGEIISADSRQVYKGMDIGTGKDISEYVMDGLTIPYHLIDIVEPGYEYNVYEFKKDFYEAFNTIIAKNNTPILCGGTGLYIESVLRDYDLKQVPYNEELRNNLNTKTLVELVKMLSDMRKLHNTTDTEDRNRVIRAIEIETYYRMNNEIEKKEALDAQVFGIFHERDVVRKRITERLHARLKTGMIEEIEALIKNGIAPEKLKFYGLEYRFVTEYLLGEIDYKKMVELLNIAIQQFAKRQMTYFRRMERNGLSIHWIDGDNKLEKMLDALNI